MSRLAHGPSIFSKRLPIGGPGSQDNDTYLAKVVKLIPAEVVATYTAIFNLIPALTESWRMPGYWVNLVFFWVMTPIVLLIAGKREGKQAGWLHFLISTIAFGVWAYAVSGQTVAPKAFQSSLAGIVLLLFTFVSGLVSLP